jgi:hypothetical protein
MLGLVAGSALGAGGCGGNDAAGFVFTISGEVLALGGYGFPRATQDDPAFVDGWELEFSEVLVTVDKITISENPDLDPGDQAKTGQLVAEALGPWAVDLHKGGPLPGKGGTGEQAVQIVTLDNQNKNGGAPFAADTRYAFGFDIVESTAGAKIVNLDDQGKADYALMQQNGYTVLYVGTATFKGTSCTPPTTDPAFATFPTVVNFKLGFKSPATYVNCQNPDNDPAKAFGQEEHERGIVGKKGETVTAQLTVHTDHPFWDSFLHDSPAHFDMVAAQYTGSTGTPDAVLEDMKGVDPTAITDKQKNKVPRRTCDKFYTPPNMGQLSLNTTGVPVDPTGDPATSIRDLYDYMTYNQSTQGHLNSDGLCFVERRYPSPP